MDSVVIPKVFVEPKEAEEDLRPLHQKIEELQILTKLGRTNEALGLGKELLKTHPHNIELAKVIISLYLDKGMTKEADDLITCLEQRNKLDGELEEYKLVLLMRENRWEEAYKLGGSLVEDSPRNIGYLRDYAYILTKLNLWPEATGAYYKIFESEKDKKDYPYNDLWSARTAALEGRTLLWTDFLYEHDAKTERHYTWQANVRWWVAKHLRATIGAFKEYHRRGQYQDLPHLSANVTGVSASVDWFANSIFTITGEASLPHMNNYNDPEIGIKVVCDKDYYPSFYAEAGFVYNQLNRDIDKITKQTRMNRFDSTVRITPFDRLSLTYLFAAEWMRINPVYNTYTGKGYMGRKVWNGGSANFTLFSQTMWSLSAVVDYFHAHWSEPFPQADQVLDFSKDEETLYGGLVGEVYLWSVARIVATGWRKYAAKRKFYSTLANMVADVWLSEDLVLKLFFDYKYKDNPRPDPGVSYDVYAMVKMLF